MRERGWWGGERDLEREGGREKERAREREEAEEKGHTINDV